jgi:hypothetical protein
MCPEYRPRVYFSVSGGIPGLGGVVYVRFTPESDIKCDIWECRVGPIADILESCRLTGAEPKRLLPRRMLENLKARVDEALKDADRINKEYRRSMQNG